MNLVTRIDKKTLILGIIFMLCGLGLCIYSYFSINSYKEKDSVYIETNALVVDYKYNDEGLMAIIAEYEVSGNKYRITSNVYSSHNKSIGEAVAVKYNPQNPSDAIWKNDNSIIFVSIVGGVFFVVGVFTTILYFKKRS